MSNTKKTKQTDSEQSDSRKLPTKWSAMLSYDPYKVFDTRKGCITAVGLCITFILVIILNGTLNGNWLSLVFVPLYLLIIRNRLRKLRSMA